MQEFDPFSSPMYVMLKPAGALCNLRCRYCYYLEKKHLYAGSDSPGVMSYELLERFIDQYITSTTTAEVLFTWHGGEAMMRPLKFYERAVELQRQYARGRVIDNCLQTNGTLLTDDWCRFLADNHWLVGVSIDGTQQMHDRYRTSQGGKPSWREVMRGIERLNRFGVDWNAMAVVNDYNSLYPLEFYRFFKEIGCRYLQFTPIVERLHSYADGRHLAAPCSVGDELAPFSVDARQWGEFLCQVFDEWVCSDVGEYFVQMFDSTLANWVGVEPGVCSLSRHCGHAGVMEHNGDVYSCDHFVFPEYRLGNIHTQTLVEMMYGERQRRFGAQKRQSLPTQCRQCDYLFACNGECPKNRIITTASGEPGLNYLCEGYHRFFAHVRPYMEYMRGLLEQQQPPSLVMDAIRRGDLAKP